jgi:aconitate hydratase
MAQNVTQKLNVDHLISGQIKQGQEIALKIDQTLTQDATGIASSRPQLERPPN